MLARKNRLTNRTDFSAVYSKGNYLTDGNITIKFLNSGNKTTRIGFSIGKNFSKKAVERNKIRRLLQEIIRLNLSFFKPGFDIIIMLKPGFEKNNFKEINAILKHIMQKANLTN
jgi:ribonuclease P protein component